jgi:hypothetical protein
MTSTPLDIPFARAAGERRLYTAAAIAGLAIVFAGFAPTYYLKGAFGTPELTALKHIHGIVMTAWFALFLVQARLIATGRVLEHRKLGILGVLLAVLVVSVGMTIAIASARSGSSPLPSIPPLVFLVMPLGEMFAFTVLFTAAIVLRRHGAWHKRFMLLATIAMLTPAVARLPFETIQARAPFSFFAGTDLVILACIAFDTYRNRRVHPAFLIGLAFVAVVQVGRLLLARTPEWTMFAKWLVG